MNVDENYIIRVKELMDLELPKPKKKAIPLIAITVDLWSDLNVKR